MLQRDRKHVAMHAFPGNRDPLSLTLGGPAVSLVCGFIKPDNLLAWRELFTNVNELKSRI